MARWAGAPLTWRGLSAPGPRLRAVGRRTYDSLRIITSRRNRSPAARPATPAGYLLPSPGAGTLPLYGAVHPMTGDQLLSTNPAEPSSLGYDGSCARAWHSFTRTPTVAATADPTARLSSLSSSRYPVWKSAIKAFKAHPAGGTGAGTFEFWWNEHGTTGESVQDTHNIWLENMAELGLPGLLLIIAVAAAAIGLAVTARIRARRNATAGCAAAFAAVLLVYLLHATVDWMWESTAATVLPLVGIAVVGVRLSVRRLRLGLPARAALVAAAAAAAILQLPGMLSTTDIRNSQAAERDGNSKVALERARDGVSAEPWSASAHEQEALVLEATGRLRQAQQQETLAISREQYNSTHWLIRSRIETELSRLRPAVRDYGRAVQLHPHALVFALAPYFTTR
jgi:hypothetical protein